MAELTSSRRYGRPCCTRTKAHNPAAPPGIAGLIAALSGLANSQFPLASPSRPDAAKPLDSRRLRLYDGAMEIALFQPDIAGNVGTILRTAACFGAPAHIIEPCGFPFGDAALKRSEERRVGKECVS